MQVLVSPNINQVLLLKIVLKCFIVLKDEAINGYFQYGFTQHTLPLQFRDSKLSIWDDVGTLVFLKILSKMFNEEESCEGLYEIISSKSSLLKIKLMLLLIVTNIH